MRLTGQRAAGRLHGDGRRPVPMAWFVTALVLTLLLIFQLDRVTGDAPVQHLYYIPILFAASRFGLPGGFAVAAAAIVLYHLAGSVTLLWRFEHADVFQSLLFVAVAIVTARLADDRRRLRQLAITDDLTGLHNLRSFEVRLAQMVRVCRVAGAPLAMLVLDLDRLKSLNDQHGHLAGADAVRTVGRVLATGVPSTGVACRFGGDEFVVAIPECPAPRAEEVANDIRRAVKALSPELARQSFPSGTLSVSIGVACLPFDGLAGAAASDPSDIETGELLFRAADRSLYLAKEQGRDRVSVVALSPTTLMRQT